MIHPEAREETSRIIAHRKACRCNKPYKQGFAGIGSVDILPLGLAKYLSQVCGGFASTVLCSRSLLIQVDEMLQKKHRSISIVVQSGSMRNGSNRLLSLSTNANHGRCSQLAQPSVRTIIPNLDMSCDILVMPQFLICDMPQERRL